MERLRVLLGFSAPLVLIMLVGCAYKVKGYTFDVGGTRIINRTPEPDDTVFYDCPPFTTFENMYAEETVYQEDGKTVNKSISKQEPTDDVEAFTNDLDGGEYWVLSIIGYDALGDKMRDVATEEETDEYPYGGIIIGTHRLCPKDATNQILGVTVHKQFLQEPGYDRVAIACEEIETDFWLPDLVKVYTTSHEMGHVFGLDECSNFCVMKDNCQPGLDDCETEEEAKAMIPTDFCEDCRDKIDRYTKP